jgi:hypothetical protein
MMADAFAAIALQPCTGTANANGERCPAGPHMMGVAEYCA